MKLGGIFIRSVMVEAGITISQNLGDLFPTYIANYKLSQLLLLNFIVNTVDHDMSLGNAKQMLREHSVGMSYHYLF